MGPTNPEVIALAALIAQLVPNEPPVAPAKAPAMAPTNPLPAALQVV